jgi:TRAP-type mannitol/chloroaromatic compound transport system permease small subunit
MSPPELAAPLGATSVVVLGGLAPLLALPLATALAGAGPGQVLRPAVEICEGIASVLGRFAQLCLVMLALGMLGTVLLRYVFGESFTRLNEAVMYAHALGFLMAGPAALIANAHVRVDVLYERFAPATRCWVDILGFSLFLAPFMLLLLAYSGPVVNLAWRIGERSNETDGLPLVWLLKTAMPVFAVAMLAAGLAHAGRAALRLRGLEGELHTGAQADPEARV